MCLFKNLFLLCVEAVIVSNYMGYCNYDDLDNFINPDDLNYLTDVHSTTPSPNTSPGSASSVSIRMPETSKDALDAYNFTQSADCFGLGGITTKLSWIFNLKPQHSYEIQPDYFFYNRILKTRVQVMDGDQFGLEWTYYDAKKPTIVIVHGFLSYSQASWVVNMTNAFLAWDDVNVITVDWSKGGNTWKYWRAVANTRTVGADLAAFLRQLMNATNAQTKDFHFVGHSLGAHICSFAAMLLGGVRRITGLDPAQPCFVTTDLNMLLDKSDADFVDIIHTNGREISKLGFGVPTTCGHQDFYPNGGMKQPGCHTGKASFLNSYIPISKAKLMRAICNHGRAYLLFTESLKPHNCSLVGHLWNISYTGVNASINEACSNTSCAEMGIRADHYPARGPFYVVTTSKEPYCETTPKKVEVRDFLLSDLQSEHEKNMTAFATTTPATIKKGWFSFFSG